MTENTINCNDNDNPDEVRKYLLNYFSNKNMNAPHEIQKLQEENHFQPQSEEGFGSSLDFKLSDNNLIEINNDSFQNKSSNNLPTSASITNLQNSSSYLNLQNAFISNSESSTNSSFSLLNPNQVNQGNMPNIYYLNNQMPQNITMVNGCPNSRLINFPPSMYLNNENNSCINNPSLFNPNFIKKNNFSGQINCFPAYSNFYQMVYNPFINLNNNSMQLPVFCNTFPKSPMTNPNYFPKNSRFNVNNNINNNQINNQNPFNLDHDNIKSQIFQQNKVILTNNPNNNHNNTNNINHSNSQNNINNLNKSSSIIHNSYNSITSLSDTPCKIKDYSAKPKQLLLDKKYFQSQTENNDLNEESENLEEIMKNIKGNLHVYICTQQGSRYF